MTVSNTEMDVSFSASTHIREVILGQHRVGGISGAIVVEDNVLLLLGRVNELAGAGHELIFDVVDQRNDEGGNDREDKARKFFLELLNDLGQDRDLLHGGRDALHDLIVELDGRHNLVVSLLDILGELLRLPG